jgi:hypothetical protein
MLAPRFLATAVALSALASTAVAQTVPADLTLVQVTEGLNQPAQGPASTFRCAQIHLARKFHDPDSFGV